MNYAETLSYLYEQLPMFQRVGAAAYRNDLRNTTTLAAIADNPEDGFKSVHIAGTNGKGSTAHGLASVMQAASYKVGLMTSPHYKDFRERIRIDGQMIEEQYVVDWVAKYQRHFEPMKPSFFELTVIMGFCYFKEQAVDIAIIETGMGGRLDSTNIVSPELSIITPIGLDHTAFLGDTLPAVALEKAGIIKRETPVLIAQGNDEVLDVFTSVAADRKAPLHQVKSTDKMISTDLKGSYQQHNMATVQAATQLLRDAGWRIGEADEAKGLRQVISSTGLVGRWQIISKSPRVIADSAHNPAGISTVLDNLKAEKYKHLHIVIGMVSDKDVDAVLSLLPLGATYYFCQAKVMRALSCDMIAQQGMRMGMIGECYGSVQAALSSAREAAREYDLILVTGSVFTVAEVV